MSCTLRWRTFIDLLPFVARLLVEAVDWRNSWTFGVLFVPKYTKSKFENGLQAPLNYFWTLLDLCLSETCKQALFVTAGLCKCKSTTEPRPFIQTWLIQRHSSSIMGIIFPTLCHKCMQHASEWHEQWPLSLPSPAWRWGGASWEADRQTGPYSSDTSERPHTNPGNKQRHLNFRYGPCVNYVLGLLLLCKTHTHTHTGRNTPSGLEGSRFTDLKQLLILCKKQSRVTNVIQSFHLFLSVLQDNSTHRPRTLSGQLKPKNIWHFSGGQSMKLSWLPTISSTNPVFKQCLAKTQDRRQTRQRRREIQLHKENNGSYFTVNWHIW